MVDPFASAADSHVLHPALSTCNKLPIGFFEPLVSDYLRDERYVKWSAGYRPWQLHCYGGPGSGKSVFAARVVEDLRKRYNDKSIFVAYIRVKEHVSDHYAGFVEDFLFCLYSQVCTRPAHDYERARQSGQSSSERLKQIRAALYQQLTENEHSFLILDGYDTLDMATCMLVDQELKNPHVSNLSLLVTRRSLPYQRPNHFNVGCDGCGRSRLELYWECQICGHAGPQYCCECEQNGALCTNQEHKLALSEPYDRIDLKIGGAQSAMIDFVTRELGSLPAFNGQAIKQLAYNISEKSGGNINLAKLRVDDLLQEKNLADGQTQRDRLPRSVVAFFDAEIDKIKQSNQIDCDLGLLAVAAVASNDDPRGFGVKATDLEVSIRHERCSSAHLARHLTRSLEDVIIAANGLLVLQPYEDDLYVACFSQMFKLYVKEDYNESLYMAKSKLYVDGTLRSRKSSWNIAPTTASPPTISEGFDAKDYVDARSSSQDSAYYSKTPTIDATMTNLDGKSRIVEPKGLFERSESFEIQSSDIVEQADFSEKISPSMSLCTFCQKCMLDSSEISGEHHLSVETIRHSVDTNCIICTDLYLHLFSRGSEVSKVHTQERQHCRYQWTIRSTGRSQNVDSSLQIILTPISHNKKLGRRQITRRYHVLSEKDVNVASRETLPSSTDPNAPGGGAQIREWIKVCADTHPNCHRHSNSKFVPTRLVDLEVGDLDMVRVVNTSQEKIKGPYLTLSHSWGPPTFLQLKKENESRLMGPGVKIAELTKNFRQAISVARFIGLRYIWIDSLCIMQGPGGDFKSEGQLMHKVYRHSFCNIAIADSEDSEGGLFRGRGSVDIIPIEIEADGNGKLERGNWRILRDGLWDEELLSTKIYTRGWVFQERMLAPRILHFAATQIFWDCSTISACEALPRGLPHALDTNAATDRHWRGRMQLASSDTSDDYQQALVGANDDSTETFWQSAVLSYTSCNLTNQGDKSIAIWSIAKLVRDILDESYSCGLWETNLAEQLAWHAREPAVGDSGRIPELQYRYPSWSWASMKGSIVARNRLAQGRQYVVTNHDGNDIAFESQFENTNEEPKLKRVPMELFGYVSQAQISRELGMYTLTLDLPSRAQQGSAVSFDLFPDEAPSAIDDGPKSCTFIVLAASATSADGRQVYLSSQHRSSGKVARPAAHSKISESPEGGAELSSRTYSGIGLLLIGAKAYKKQQDEAFKAHLREVVARSPEKSWPDPPYGQGKSLVDQTIDRCMLVATLHSALSYVKEQGGNEDSLYRRTGALEFSGMSEEEWRAMTDRGASKIWLD